MCLEFNMTTCLVMPLTEVFFKREAGHNSFFTRHRNERNENVGSGTSEKTIIWKTEKEMGENVKMDVREMYVEDLKWFKFV